LPLVVDEGWVERLRGSLPELPQAKRKRFASEYGIPDSDAGVLTSDKRLADYYEACVAAGADSKKASNWIMAELLRELKNDDRPITDCPIKPGQLAAMIRMIDSGEITGKIGKTVFVEMYKSGRDPGIIVEEQGLKPMADTAQIERICEKAIADNPGQVEQYQAGKTKVMGFFVGLVMKATGGKADPRAVNEILKNKLK